jgi:hypothetical protein
LPLCFAYLYSCLCLSFCLVVAFAVAECWFRKVKVLKWFLNWINKHGQSCEPNKPD